MNRTVDLPNGVQFAVQVHEAIASVALSHGEGHDCTTCRAARGDKHALALLYLAMIERHPEGGIA